ncbi:translation initiation factor IF-2 subunit gamma [Candidatus Aciduliprofundum boonei]|uniref:Translation initiation factor 2 subunit gamma n=1 Tax=Aciduliprofundum boonei (strain DSM 19572 / T469) TaxID=439481 RepID=B5IAM8_ACIB4|nr:translation initiation factor IF-2 subunit gamma [Candidatus Aciduliprofundum boonei]ADD08612.1 protein synthesis factor GTP-binding protein [Aciduliprofundum boonei T469]EDY36254.1 Initiation factor eIF2 gamma, C terminal domain family [Aciduliprofundum boonei T469]EDY37087.1 Initiation factor eIF2 gamma, C terminal domain family [Aciduliprofundum boonei T469]HII54833.1 translation initiation factor IF-2 subunit gamma [Candidatus Aciduliprofundum boonei]
MSLPKQPEVNIGMVGHVDHGKTTLTKAITGKWTDTHSEEMRRGITIKLGYADAAFYKCKDVEPPSCYVSNPSKCPNGADLLRVVSFVDAPGHETLMATMLSGAAIMNGALLVIAANQKCPQPQTKEHLMALDIVGVKKIIIVQNKIDLVDDDRARENYREIKEFVKGTVAEDAPIIPVSAHHDANIDVLIEAIEQHIPTPKFDPSKPPRLYIARSFDVNKPGTRPKDLVGGVIGGSLIQGKFKVGDEIEILPGFYILKGNKVEWEPIHTEIVSLMSGGKYWDEIKPGGLVGIGTKLDPAITKNDGLIGRMAGKPGTLPPVLTNITMDVHLLERVVGSREERKVEKIKTNELLMLNIGTLATVGIVTSGRDDTVELKLKYPAVAEKGQRVAIGRRIENRWRLIGYGIIK